MKLLQSFHVLCSEEEDVPLQFQYSPTLSYLSLPSLTFGPLASIPGQGTKLRNNHASATFAYVSFSLTLMDGSGASLSLCSLPFTPVPPSPTSPALTQHGSLERDAVPEA